LLDYKIHIMPLLQKCNSKDKKKNKIDLELILIGKENLFPFILAS